MSEPNKVSKAELFQLLEHRNEMIKSTIGDIYIQTSKGILKSPPFAYNEAISKDVADGIVNYGDKLMANAIPEEDDHGEMEELNSIGDDFQAMQPSVALMLTVNEEVAKKKDLERGSVRKLYPMLPDEEFYIADAKVERFDKALEEARKFLRTKARRGFAATIALVGESNEDGIQFKSGQTIPIGVVEMQIKQMLENRGDQLIPRVVDIVVVKQDGSLQVSAIRVGSEKIENYLVTD